MAEREVLFLLDAEGRVLFADAGPNAAELPDSRARWEAIWTRRAELHTVAHSHPCGPLAFSPVDRRTMAALDLALGRPLRYAVVAPSGVVVQEDGHEAVLDEEPPWAAQLLEKSR